MRVSRRPALMMVQLRKIEHHRNPFAQFPQQSDYAALWESSETRAGAVRRVKQLAHRLPLLLGLGELLRSSRLNTRAYSVSRLRPPRGRSRPRSKEPSQSARAAHSRDVR